MTPGEKHDANLSASSGGMGFNGVLKEDWG